MMPDRVSYFISAGQYGDGKSVVLWRNKGAATEKIAIFQNAAAVKIFAAEFGFPLSDVLKERIGV